MKVTKLLSVLNQAQHLPVMTCDWDKDEFMSEWDRTYVATNLKPDASPYDRSFFIGLNDELEDRRPELKPFSYAIIVS